MNDERREQLQAFDFSRYLPPGTVNGIPVTGPRAFKTGEVWAARMPGKSLGFIFSVEEEPLLEAPSSAFERHHALVDTLCGHGSFFIGVTSKSGSHAVRLLAADQDPNTLEAPESFWANQDVTFEAEVFPSPGIDVDAGRRPGLGLPPELEARLGGLIGGPFTRPDRPAAPRPAVFDGDRRPSTDADRLLDLIGLPGQRKPGEVTQVMVDLARGGDKKALEALKYAADMSGPVGTPPEVLELLGRDPSTSAMAPPKPDGSRDTTGRELGGLLSLLAGLGALPPAPTFRTRDPLESLLGLGKPPRDFPSFPSKEPEVALATTQPSIRELPQWLNVLNRILLKAEKHREEGREDLFSQVFVPMEDWRSLVDHFRVEPVAVNTCIGLVTVHPVNPDGATFSD